MRPEALEEWRALRTGLLVVAAFVVASVGGSLISAAVDDPPSRLEQTSRCLRVERGLTLETPGDPIARSAAGGALRTIVEGNAVTIAIASDAVEGRRLVANYRSVAGDLGTRLERRDHNVYLWDAPPSPTQRQTVYDCAY